MSAGSRFEASAPSTDTVSLRTRFLSAIPAADEAPAAKTLDLLIAPDTLFNLSAVLIGLTTIIPIARNVTAKGDRAWPEEFGAGLSVVKDTLERLRRDPDFGSLYHGSRKNDPMWGVISNHQLYSLFAYEATGDPAHSAHAVLKANVLAAALALTPDSPDSGRGHATPLASAAKAARLLVEVQHLADNGRTRRVSL